MLQGKNPYPRNNFSIVADYLEELILILANERGLVPINEENGGYEDLEINETVISLNVPENAVSASIFFEADSQSTRLDNIVRFKENGNDPTQDSGQFYGHKDIFNPSGKDVLDKLRFIGTEADKIHFLRVQYYQTAQA